MTLGNVGQVGYDVGHDVGHKRMCCAVLCLGAQLCQTVFHSMHCTCQAPLSLGILQSRMLEWIAVPFSRGSSEPRDQIQVSRIAGGFFTV